MPVPGFLSSIADKAQNALNNSSLSQHIPPSLTGAGRPPAGASSSPSEGSSTHKSHTFEQIQHQFRQIQQNYSTTNPIQKIITAEKGVALDFESLSRDARAHSKELYMWGQHEHSDIKDVSDRLAFMNYIMGSLATTLAAKLNTARVPLKGLRDNEVALLQKRNIRNGLEHQISRVENSREKGYERRVAELREQLARAERDDEPIERQHEILARKALKESEQEKFQALREYGEKLALLAQAAESVLGVLPSVPPSSSQPYTGAEQTGSVRASLQYALDHWKPGQTTLSAPADAILDRSNTGSFGETHAAELERIDTTEHPGIPGGSVERPRRDSSPATRPPGVSFPVPAPAPVAVHELGTADSPPSSSQTHQGSFGSPLAVGSTHRDINPAALNNEPAQIPSRTPPVAVTLPGPVDTEAKVPTVTPTVAETGVPVSAGPGGPGPSRGSLHDTRSSASGSSPAVTNAPVPEGGSFSGSSKRYESAEEEKRRLEREERERVLHGDGPSAVSSTPVYESAEDEKKRLERKQREALLHPGDEAFGGQGDPDAEDGETPPPYQD